MKGITTCLTGLILLQNLPANAEECTPPDLNLILNIHKQKKLTMNVKGENKTISIHFDKIENLVKVPTATPGSCTYTATVTFTTVSPQS